MSGRFGTLIAQPDYSWDGLAKIALGGHACCAQTLQDYWRMDPSGSGRLDDDALKMCGLLQTVDGVLWHIAHLPAQGSWKNDLRDKTWERLEETVNARVRQAAGAGPSGSVRLDGVVLRCAPAEPEVPSGLQSAQCRVSMRDAAFLGPADFTRWRFGPDTVFARAEFHSDAVFSGVPFHGPASFIESRFKAKAEFGDTKFHGEAQFSRAEFEGWTYFERAHFFESADFEATRYFECGRFKQARFAGPARFQYATFDTKADFHLAVFQGEACFDRVEFFGVSAFLEATFEGRVSFNGALHQALCEFSDLKVTGAAESDWRSAFEGARIEALFNLAGGPYHIISAFDGAILSGWIRYPIVSEQQDAKVFKAKALNLALSAGGKQRQAALGALEGGARVLKHAMARQADSLREQHFYRYEVEARRRNKVTPPGEKLVSCLYGWTAAYGLSVMRPAVLLAAVWLVFAIGYATAIIGLNLAPGAWASMQPAAQLSLQSIATPLFAWDPDAIEASAILTGSRNADALFYLQLISTLQSFISIILIFLFARSIRRRFQIS